MLPSRVVLGVTADMSSGGTKTTTVSDASGVSANQTTLFDSETIRGRMGYAADNILFYGTGGLAWANNQFVRTQLTGTFNGATAGIDEAVNKGQMGWTAGGGIAYAFAQDWNVFAEYRYTNFAASSFSLPFSQLSGTSTTIISAVELSVNYKFTSGGQLNGAQSAPYPRGAPALVYKSPPRQYPYNGWCATNQNSLIANQHLTA
jgi:outer membrane immunogenic protein